MKSHNSGEQGEGRIADFVRCGAAVTSIEYALVAAFLSLTIMLAVGNIGEIVRDDLYQGVKDAVASKQSKENKKLRVVQQPDVDTDTDRIITGTLPVWSKTTSISE